MSRPSERLDYERAAAAARRAASRSSRSASGASSPRSMGEDLDIYGVHVGRRQRRRGRAGHARRPGARPPRAVLGRASPVSPSAPALRAAAADLRPHHLHPQGDPSAGGDRGRGGAARLAVASARASGSTCACRRAAPRPIGSRSPCATPRMAYRRRFRGAAAAPGRGDACAATSSLEEPPRAHRGLRHLDASRAARRWPAWWCGKRGGCARRTTAPSTCAACPAGRLRVDAPGGRARATAAGWRRSARCRT